MGDTAGHQALGDVTCAREHLKAPHHLPNLGRFNKPQAKYWGFFMESEAFSVMGTTVK